MRASVAHESGPFAGIAPGDVVEVLAKDGRPIGHLQVELVRRHSISGRDGRAPSKVTMLSEKELRFYSEISPGREFVSRGVSIRRVGP